MSPTKAPGVSARVFPSLLILPEILFFIKGDPESGLCIYDATGLPIVKLLPLRESSGSFIFEWDGKSSSGTDANPGFYYYKTVSGTVSGKMVKVTRCRVL